MTTPVNEHSPPIYPTTNVTGASSTEENTFVGDDQDEYLGKDGDFHYLDTHTDSQDRPSFDRSPSARDQETRLNDDLAMLQAERVASSNTQQDTQLHRSMSIRRSRSKHSDPVDQFDAATNPIHEQTAVYRPPEHPTTNLAKIVKRVHNSSFLVRYFTYITPLVLVLLIPLLLGKLVFKDASVGGVQLFWFSIWLEIVWLTLWAGRLVAKMIPWPLGLVASLFTNNSKKWRDMGKQLEIPATIFFWWLGIEISFLPTMRGHHVAGVGNQKWENTMNKVIVAIFIGATFNFVEKIIIQLIAISFHLRTYADRIELNKFQIGSLVKLYQFSKEKIQLDDSDFEERDASGPASGSRTPMQYLDKAQKNVTEAFNKVGDVAGKVAGDFTGKTVAKSTHPHQVVLMLLNTTTGSQVLARRLYRTFVRDGADTVFSDDLKNAFDNQEEADAAFSMFDKDLNGDISMEELESVCVEIGRERKSITASLKDLDSVVSKLDAVLFFVVIIIFLLSLITLVSISAAGVLTSAGSTVLALSWLFSATAQEFLQSVIFVFVKHPFDVGDRVTIYGNTGSMMRGDDYFVKEISLLYTEFKKMEGHVVQAPNSYLNTLFILNMRRSGGLAEAVPLTIRFGTTLEQIDALRSRLLEFVKAEKREYQGNILTEIRDVVEAYSINLNVVFFYKSNWQNELLRLQRRNKFICAMMVSMQEIGIQGPRANIPGRTSENPYHISQQTGLTPITSKSNDRSQHQEPAFVPTLNKRPSNSSFQQQPSILRNGASVRTTRPRGESVSAMSRRVDFSLGMKDVVSGNLMGDVYDDEPNQGRLPDKRVTSPSRSRSARREDRIDEEAEEEMEADEKEKKRGNVGRSSSRAERGSVTSPSKKSKFSLHRSSTESEAKGRMGSVIHKNRFFGKKAREKEEVESEYQDLMMESGMAELPEGEGGGSRNGSVGTAGRARGDSNAVLPRWEERKDEENYEMRRLV